MSTTALIVAHPGHELVVHRWLCTVRPRVFVLTDGSGRGGTPRVASSRALCQSVGAPCGETFGGVTDRRVYEALLERDCGFVVNLASRLADELAKHSVSTLCGDALEGYNPTHDLCRALINAVAKKIGISRREHNLMFELAAPHARDSSGATRLCDAAWAAKIAAGERYTALAAELAHARSAWGLEAYQVETLEPCDVETLRRPYRDTPHFERVGEERVRMGSYRDVVRAREHMNPMLDAIADWSS